MPSLGHSPHVSRPAPINKSLCRAILNSRARRQQAETASLTPTLERFVAASPSAICTRAFRRAVALGVSSARVVRS